MFTVRRPLPAGTYEIRRREYPDAYKACGYAPDWAFTDFVVTVTAPPGTVHEAFFDPATTTAGVGYSAGSATTTRVLEPAGFSVGGRAITITGLAWHNGQVVLTVDRVVSDRQMVSSSSSRTGLPVCVFPRRDVDQRLGRPHFYVGGIGAAVGGRATS